MTEREESRMDHSKRETCPDSAELSELLQKRMPLPIREEKPYDASVLIPLIQKEDGTLEILFEVRSSELNGQPGDSCFPGGKAEKGERPAETAIRETCEELLVSPESIRLLGPSDYLDNGRLRIYPYAGKLLDYRGTFSRDEVAEVFTVPLNFFLTHEPDRRVVEWKPDLPEDFPFEKIFGGRDYAWRKRKDTILFYEYQGHVIWGMTAKILEAFLKIAGGA